MRTLILVAALSLFAVSYAHDVGGSIEHALPDGPKPWTGDTPDLGPGDFRFAVVSDNSGRPRPGVYREAMEKAELLQPAFVMSIGDMIDGRTEDTKEGSHAEIHDQWDEFMGYLDPLTAPFFFVPGNHDVGKSIRKDVWAERFGPMYYHFVYGGCLFIVLDSTNFSEDQVEWARGILDEHEDVRWTFFFQHHPHWISDLRKWAPYADLLEGREKLTVFGGHVHNYVHTHRGNVQYITMATTGGGSRMRGPHFGEFDHLMWVTMTEQGPVLAAVALDGVLEPDYRTTEIANALRPFNNGTAVAADVVEIDSKSFKSGEWTLAVTNPWDKPLRFEGLVDAPSTLAAQPSAVSMVVEPGESASRTIRISASKKMDIRAFEPPAVRWKATYDLGNRAPIEFEDLTRLYVDTVYRSERVENVTVDGNLKDWGSLPFAMSRPGAVQLNELAWRGSHDCSIRFGVAHDDESIYAAIHVEDDDISGEGIGVLQDYGRALFRAVGPKPATADWSADGIVTIVTGPDIGEATRVHQETYWRLPNESKDFGGVYAMRLGDGVVTYEFSVPRSELARASGTTTEHVQVNIAVNDHDDADARYGQSMLLWRPLWVYRGRDSRLGVFKLD